MRKTREQERKKERKKKRKKEREINGRWNVTPGKKRKKKTVGEMQHQEKKERDICIKKDKIKKRIEVR